MTTALRWLRRLGIAVGMIATLLLVMQLVPYGHTHSNPPVLQEPSWDSPHTRELAVRACFDCHSNETRWPWYANVAPFSWTMQRDVDAGRNTLNFSEWTHSYDVASAVGSDVLGGEMPPRSYRMMHGLARLTETERLELARGLHATLGLPWRE